MKVTMKSFFHSRHKADIGDSLLEVMRKDHKIDAQLPLCELLKFTLGYCKHSTNKLKFSLIDKQYDNYPLLLIALDQMILGLSSQQRKARIYNVYCTTIGI